MINVVSFRVTRLIGSLICTHKNPLFTLDANVVLVNNKKQKNYFTIDEIHDLALSGADRKALALLEKYFV